VGFAIAGGDRPWTCLPMNTRNRAAILGHTAIGRALRLGISEARAIDSMVTELVQSEDAAMRRRAPKMLIGTAVRSFMWHHDLRSTHQLIAIEHPCGDGFVDLVWADRADDTILFDEIKTGLVLAHETPDHQRQTDRYVVDGRRIHGAQFRGVRCLPLLSQARASFKSSPGLAYPLPAELRGGDCR
jgi:hypothetical protein